MEFELDEYYFNADGVKVICVGYDDKVVFFRRSDNTVTLAHYDSIDDTLWGKWEITNDPDRVYIIRVYIIDDREVRYGHRFTWRHLPFGCMNDDIEMVKKILIKPLNLKPGKIELVRDDSELITGIRSIMQEVNRDMRQREIFETPIGKPKTKILPKPNRVTPSLLNKYEKYWLGDSPLIPEKSKKIEPLDIAGSYGSQFQLDVVIANKINEIINRLNQL